MTTKTSNVVPLANQKAQIKCVFDNFMILKSRENSVYFSLRNGENDLSVSSNIIKYAPYRLFFWPITGIHRSEAFQMYRYNKTELNDTVNVCITSDKYTLMGTIALINSIDQNSKHPVKYHLVVDKGSGNHIR